MIFKIPTDSGTETARADSVQRLVLPIAVLCVAKKSVYKTLKNVECYDPMRDVRTFAGGMPVVAHPPCRSWSAYCAHQAKPEPGEKELGPLCVEWLKKCGGVLEHPAHSRLWDACNLPKPGQAHRGNGLWTIEVLQAWWGDTRTKTTWLCFSDVNPLFVVYPLRLHDSRGDRRRWQLMGKQQRSATHPAFAQWLVDMARNAGRPASEWDGQNVELCHAVKLKGNMNSSENSACPRIYTRCPACHNDTLTVNKGHLLCTWFACPNPTLLDYIGDPHIQIIWPTKRAGDRQPATTKVEGVKALASATGSVDWCEHISAVVNQSGRVMCYVLDNPFMNQLSIPANWQACPICLTNRPKVNPPNK